MKLNIEDFLPLLKGDEHTQKQKEHIIHTVCSFAEAMVDEAFSLHPVQQTNIDSAEILQFPKNSLDSNNALNTGFAQAANDNYCEEELKKHG